ncbi:MAG: arabinose-5-phosphate isomerase [Polynucleobacter sp. 24-46-87]|uniref:KpsF/GutQ family sugar-phosphate isomerase n=1 Tax=unclassified Polynucleobacter TaxID=2640945 RepID=UPI000BD215EE|nr:MULTISPECIES: KpsF/GutQ family sugar-phosphate isomerase [unclassified Polynucleobacter]OYY16706.1 MAG: arabinose-5-phosphate isomerase [Polynucleobacter sp. 35-46-11]OZA14997.1 MAG: arabinose-5-phosphate isomerase [Polynucleobacter sp. 24-46-87]OZA76236.1 MAG: arabinose-5-phosphate isomerase [Polynucleobacter sp. 39-46-10]
MIAKTRDRTLKLARDTLTIEAAALHTMRDRLEGANADALVLAVDLLHSCKGRIVVSGIGKSGHIARKIAATFASTGSPAFFVHPAEASHGDLGMVTRDDVFVALSNSGETDELLTIVPIVKRTGAKLIALTGAPNSSLAKLADAHLDTSVEKEACPLNLAPTTSTTASLAMGDALAVALLDARGFQAEDFQRSHPGGRLGRKQLMHVSEVMRNFDETPKIAISASLQEALLEMTAKRMGMVVTLNNQNKVAGIFTDGDLRRLLEKSTNLDGLTLEKATTSAPRTIPPELLAEEAIEMMEKHRINHLVVTDSHGVLLGALNLHDLFAAKVI